MCCRHLHEIAASGAIRRASSRVKGPRYPNVEVGWRCVECQLASWGLVPSHLFECTRACPLKGEDAVPIVLHANHYPTLVLRLVMERLGERTDLGVWQSLCRAVGVLALGIIMQHEHREPRTITGTCVLQHLSVARRVAERSARTAGRSSNGCLRACRHCRSFCATCARTAARLTS